MQVRDTDALGAWVDAVLADHPDEVARFRRGEAKLLGFFVGQVMKRSGGSADPKAAAGIAPRTPRFVTDVASVAQIRDAFPALRRKERGVPVAYFDGPGGTQVPAVVADAMVDYLLNHNANTHWDYPSSRETDAMLDDARETFGDVRRRRRRRDRLRQQHDDAHDRTWRGALGRAWQAGDEVIVTELDHHANVAPWQALVRERGVVLRWVPLDAASGRLDLTRFPALLGPRTRLVAIGAASNALGTITDVASLARLAREAGALVFVDAVHLAPHVLLDVAALECDFLACSTYKFYGPHGGVLWGRRALLDAVDVPRLEPAPATAPGATRDRHAESRGDRGRCRGGAVARLTRGW